jgi:ABC-type nitrate/sulfonate/bicarbonate transport system substrate-binding protein
VNAARRLAAALACAAFALVAPVFAADAPQKIKITVPSYEVADGAYFVAVQKGYFAGEGLDVEIELAGGGTATPALMSGSIDGSASSASALSAILKGAPLRIALVFEESPFYNIWGHADIHSLADFKGKSLGVATRGDTFEIAARLALAQAGIAQDAVGFTPIGSGLGSGAAFETGALAGVVLSTSQGMQSQDKGQLKNAHIVASLLGKVHMPWNGFVVSEKLMYGNPALTRRILRAVIKGERYLKAYKSQTLALVRKYNPTIQSVAQSEDYDEFVRGLTRDLTVTPQVAQADLDLRSSLLNMPKDQVPPLDKVYDFSLVRSINAELDASRWKPTP